MLHCGDCTVILPTLPSASVDCVVTDPPYPHIKRSYGHWTEAEWFALMDRVVPECRRVLKPSGSAVFILQPNSERVGRMRTWLLRFILKWAEEWGWVQDAYWWNLTTLPGGGINAGLLRPSLKPCVWLGKEDCYRDQTAVLWGKGEWHRSEKAAERAGVESYPCGRTINVKQCLSAAERRGGVMPFNVLPYANNHSKGEGGDFGHGAATPMAVAEWWIRYLCPPGGSVLDPFAGSGTVPLAAEKLGRQWVGIEKEAEYVAVAERRLAEARAACPLFAPPP